MKIPFRKYQGTGNDFVIIDQMERQYLSRQDVQTVKRLCDRRFGIGADGLILVESHQDFDCEMIYFNADGRESSMCGNGGRCLTAFVINSGILAKNQISFLAIDGKHVARYNQDHEFVELLMNPVSKIQQFDSYSTLDTGSPHYVTFVEDVDDIDVQSNGRAIRYSTPFREEGINVNFVEIMSDNQITMATYERGVEGETLSCGTGVTAAALAYLDKKGHGTQKKDHKVNVQTKGGNLYVKASYVPAVGFDSIWLCGPATEVYQGEIEVKTN